MIADMAVSFAANHAQMIEGMAIGYAAAHVPQLTAIVFHQLLRVPVVRAAILRDPARSKAIIQEIEKELEKDIDSEAAADAGAKG